MPVKHRRQPLRTALAHQVGQRVSIQHRQKFLKGVLQHSLQLTHRSDDARVRLHVEAFHDRKICLGRANDVANANLRWIARKNRAAISAGRDADIAGVTEPLHDPHKVMP